MKPPQDHSRRLLVAVTGLSPQIVTETLYALAVEQESPFLPTEVRLITTEEGAQRAELDLLHPQTGWFHRLRADYDLPPIAFGPEQIHVLGDAGGRPLSDIRSPGDNTCAADAITDLMRALTRDDDSALHVSIAGGRKTMGFYLGYALSLYGRLQDRLSHVLVSAPYESHPQFFYPSRASEVIYTPPPHNRPYDKHDAEITLADIPFVRLREGLNPALPALIEGAASFSGAVAAAQRAIGPPELVIDLRRRMVRAGGRVIALSPAPLAFLAWLARRQAQGEEWLACPTEGAPEPPYAVAFLAEYRAIIGEMGDDEGTAKRLRAGMTSDFFSQNKSKLHQRLKKALGAQQAWPYLIARVVGDRARRRYGLDIASHAIRFEPIETAQDERGPERRGTTLPDATPGESVR